ncbi:MAG: SDR family oxidoreductase [Anaerolineales bacterium]
MKANLEGKTALITGASSGLGAEFARQFAALGCSLILVARRLERLQALQAELSGRYAASVECMSMDLAEVEAPLRLFTQIKETGQTVDILVNNAGFGLYGDFLATPWERLHQMLELDIMTLTQLTHLYAAEMVKRNSGAILLIGSIASFQPTPTYAAYAAAKSYVLSLGEALHYELRHTNVRCCVLCPGVTRTEFLEAAGQQPSAYQRVTMMEGDAVVRSGIQALLQGRSSVVPGWINAGLAWGTRLLPRQALAAVSARLMR